jgi:hypothetical protein
MDTDFSTQRREGAEGEMREAQCWWIIILVFVLE